MCLCTSRVGGIVWDSGCDLLPTKTSRVGSVVREVSFFGWYMLPGVHHEAGEPFSLFYLGSYYLVVCEPYIVAQSPLACIFLLGIVSSWTTLPQRRTHIRKADLERRRRRRPEAPHTWGGCWLRVVQVV